ncbi:hypothetical protein Pyn_10282 [Prunus yedoensis var. nudiflora]|uniref:Uncharacterized protein n=1 Tax=Prunus yedoensis var. nudiflora TaxID=2094558 RepID=A0A314UCQ5_PRUYE|nr:hypothetical protein Pyn_10282 [Prunus yedoensis var. nudiflora]
MIDDIIVDASLNKHGRSGYGGKLSLNNKRKGVLKKTVVDGGLASKKNKVDNGLSVKRKFEGVLGLNKEVEGNDHGILCTVATSSCEVSSSQSCSDFGETSMIVLHRPPCHASPVKAASSNA